MAGVERRTGRPRAARRTCLFSRRSSATIPGAENGDRMHLTPHELDKLALHQAGYLAQKRLARGLRLNYPEAVALISTQVLEFIRDGRSVAELMDLGRQMLGRADVMEHVPEMIVEVQVEGTFPDGSKLVTVHHPIAAEHGNLDLALYGSFLPVPAKRGLTAVAYGGQTRRHGMRAGGEVDGRRRRHRHQRRTRAGSGEGDQPRRPADSGGQPLPLRARPTARSTSTAPPPRQAARHSRGHGRAIRAGRNEDGRAGRDRGQPRRPGRSVVSYRMPRRHYADIYGPTTGDRVRLGDTDLVAEVERDHTIYGDECKFGGGKVLRDGMGQAAGVSRRSRARSRHHQRAHHRLDRHLQSRRRRQTRPHRRHRQGRKSRCDGRRLARTSIVGATTEAIAGEGLILTAGGIDAHIHYICPQQVDVALASGVTTFIGGGTGPGDRHQGDDVHARIVVSRAHAAGHRRAADEFRVSRQGQQLDAAGPARADSRRRDRPEAARRLGLDARGHRLLSDASPTSTTCRSRFTPTR